MASIALASSACSSICAYSKSHSKQLSSGFKSQYLGTKLSSGILTGGYSSRMTCKINYLPPSTAKTDLFVELEEMWKDFEENPMKNVPFTAEEFSALLEEYTYDFRVGQKVRGLVTQVDNNGAYVEIGAKSPAFLPPSEASLYKLKSLEQAGVYKGAINEFEIISDDSSHGELVVSLRSIMQAHAWERVRQLAADDATVYGTVLGLNRGGLMVAVEGLRAFVPLSMVALRTPREALVGNQIAVKVLEVDEERERLVMSNRKAMSSNQVTQFSVGSVVVGTVQSVKPYGAFIDLGGVNGLLHISQISHDRITNVETVLNEGDTVKVLILSHDREKGRLSLSTKKLEPTPGDMLRNPALVFQKAEEMANTFRERVAAAEAAARAEELRLQQEGYGAFPAFASGTPWEEPQAETTE